MSIELVRLDDRLIHGQVVAGWVKYLRIKTIVVIDDDVAGDPFQLSLMKIAVPEGVDVEVGRVDMSKELLEKVEESPKKAIILVSQASDLYRLYADFGVSLEVVNIGGVRFREGREQLSETLFLSEEEIQFLANMVNDGIEVEFQPTPFDKRIDFHEILKAHHARLIAREERC